MKAARRKQLVVGRTTIINAGGIVNWSACCVRLLRWGDDVDLGEYEGRFDYIISADWFVPAFQ